MAQRVPATNLNSPVGGSDLMLESEKNSQRHSVLRGLLTDTIDEWSSPKAKTQASMRELLELGSSFKVQTPLPPLPAPVASLSPSLLGLIHSIIHDLENKSASLLNLNPSRREAIAAHLEKLAEFPSPQKTTLKQWVSIEQKSPTETRALQSFFEEVALITLGQAILLKRWADRGLRAFQANHIGKLNWELSSALKPHIPLHRESWNLTKPNLYSWYTPSSQIQEDIFRTLNDIPLSDEPPKFLLDIATQARRFAPEWAEFRGYDSRFFSALWSHLPQLGIDLKPTLLGPKTVFSPTIRFGEMAHTGPESVQWIGFESSCFQLLVAEMMDLWWGPKNPPTWAQGTALDAHPREQLCLTSPQSKPTLLQTLIEMEACEMGWLVEERSTKASQFKSQLDVLPYFKKLKAPQTSLGMLQACVAITKIRPGGKFLWIREEPLSLHEGQEALGFILTRAKLLAEGNLAEIEHSLPTKVPLFPKYFYLFQREVDHVVRFAHRPLRVHAEGSIKSHIELPLFIEDTMLSLGGHHSPQRSHWKFHIQQSPTPQKEWMSRWPDPSNLSSLSQIDAIQDQSAPLATIGTVRTINGEKNANTPAHGLLLQAIDHPRGLQITSLSQVANGAALNGVVIALEEDLIPTLRAYLQTPQITQWLDHHAERRGDKWILQDSLVKFIPVPKKLQSVLFAKRDPELEKMIQHFTNAPEEAFNHFKTHPRFKDQWTRFFVLTSAQAGLARLQTKMHPMISVSGKIEWIHLIQLFSKSDCVSMPQHSLVRMMGTLPLNSPITRIEKLKSVHGLLLMTEAGATLKLQFDHHLVFEMAWSQIQGLQHPTWSEMVQWVKLPRALEIAETTARELLQNHGEILGRLEKIKSYLG